MATTRIDNVRPEILRWAFQRAGYSEEKAVEAFPRLQDWLSGEKKPTISQLQNFASKFFVPFGYLFLQQIPAETISFPMFRGEAGQSNKLKSLRFIDRDGSAGHGNWRLIE